MFLIFTFILGRFTNGVDTAETTARLAENRSPSTMNSMSHELGSASILESKVSVAPTSLSLPHFKQEVSDEPS